MQFTMTELWGHMGLFARLIVIALGVMSLASLIVFGERLLVSLKSKSASREFALRSVPGIALPIAAAWAGAIASARGVSRAPRLPSRSPSNC